jgi:mono/diheme cytochrome c family protein
VFNKPRLRKVIGIRIVVVAAAFATGTLVLQFNPAPVGAAQNAGTQAETAPKVDAHPGQNPGAAIYAKNCAMCHGPQRKGNPPAFPSLIGVTQRMQENQIADLIHSGRKAMPPFPKIQGDELKALLTFLATGTPATAAANPEPAPPSEAVEAGAQLFHQNCAFCHGRDAMGGETGPDLTQSKLVLTDKTGEHIATVIREGRPDNKMPGFNFSQSQINDIIAFIHSREAAAKAHPGGRSGVAVEDLQTGNAQAGKQYFEGAGGCTKCHSATGDLAGIANRYKGLQLEERMLYPKGTKSTATVTLPSGEKVEGPVEYQDEFTIGVQDSKGVYRSWPINSVKVDIKSPADAHVEQFPKYTDEDVHNLMAYLQTLK